MDETIMNFDGNGDVTNLNENDKIEISKECKTNKTGSKCNMFLTKQELAEKELEGQKADLDYSLAATQLAEAAARLKSLQKLRKK